ITFASADKKNSSLPSPRHFGCSPPPLATCHFPSPSGNEVTYTSHFPLSFEVYAAHLPSGEILLLFSTKLPFQNGRARRARITISQGPVPCSYNRYFPSGDQAPG